MKKQKSFSEVAMLWKENKRNQVKRSTLSIYSLMLQKHLLPAFGHRTRVTEAHVQQFVDNKLLTLSPKTVQDLLVVPMQRVLKYHLLLKVRRAGAGQGPQSPGCAVEPTDGPD